MENIMMIYAIPLGDSVIRIRFNRKLLNYKIQSHQGRYEINSKGILTKYEKPTKSCIIFEKDSLDDVKSLCKKFKIKSRFFRVQEL